MKTKLKTKTSKVPKKYYLGVSLNQKAFDTQRNAMISDELNDGNEIEYPDFLVNDDGMAYCWFWYSSKRERANTVRFLGDFHSEYVQELWLIG